jgi:hypothetical protein
MIHRYHRALPALFAALIILPLHAQQKPAGPALPYMNPSLPIDQRVDDLIGRWACPGTTGGMRGCTAWPLPAMRRIFPM